MTKLIAVVGPTGTGKSDLALTLAESIAAAGSFAEIVNCDSMQFYRGMDIGTAKLSVDERRGIPHHLLDWLEIRDESTAAEYQIKARPVIEEIQQRGGVAIVVGGSMLYAAAVLNTFEFPARDPELRQQLEEQLIELGPNEMHRKLQLLDQVAASRIDPQNGRRILRAIEIVTVTGKPFAAALPDETQSWQPVLEIGLQGDRAALVERLGRRAESMWTDGLLDEVESLIPAGIRHGKTSRQAIGYAQALGQIDGLFTQDEAIAQTAQLTSKYARRQMSWFKRDERIHWLDFQDSDRFDQAIELVQKHVSFDQ